MAHNDSDDDSVAPDGYDETFDSPPELDDELNSDHTDATPVCPHCIEPIDPRANFCPKCGGPVSGIAFSLPLGSVYAAGYGYRQATSGRPNRLVLIGIWLIFGPNAVWTLFTLRSFATELIRRIRHLPSDTEFFRTNADNPAIDLFLGFAVTLLVFVVIVAILWRVTGRYLAAASSPSTDHD